MTRVGIRVGTLAVCVGSVCPSSTLAAQQVSAPRANTEKLVLSLALGGASIHSGDLEKTQQ